MTSFVNNIENLTKTNHDYRKILYSDNHLQLVLQCLLPGQEVGLEMHEHASQFIRCESGTGYVEIENVKYLISDGIAIIIPEKKHHNVVNNGNQNLKFYTIYGPNGHKINENEKVKMTMSSLLLKIENLLTDFIYGEFLVIQNNILKIENNYQEAYIIPKIENNDFYIELKFKNYDDDLMNKTINLLINIFKQIPEITYAEIDDNYLMIFPTDDRKSIKISTYYFLLTGKSFFELLNFVGKKYPFSDFNYLREDTLFTLIDSIEQNYNDEDFAGIKSIINKYQKDFGFENDNELFHYIKKNFKNVQLKYYSPLAENLKNGIHENENDHFIINLILDLLDIFLPINESYMYNL